MKILITGGGGYLGSYLINNLPNTYDIICLDHGKQYSQFNKLNNNITFIKGDITDSNLLEKIFMKKIDVIINCAGNAGNSVCMKDPVNSIFSHINGTKLLIQKSKKFKVKRFIHISSISVYSIIKKRKISIPEKTILEPDTFYGALKMLAENYVQENYSNYVILRLANIYGKFRYTQNKSKFGVIEHFINAALKKENITIYGSGKQKMEFIHIDDVFNCILMIIKNPEIKNEIFNVGPGKLISVAKIAKIISKSSKKVLKYEPEIKKLSNTSEKTYTKTHMSIHKIKQKINWSPKISMINGLELMLRSKEND